MQSPVGKLRKYWNALRKVLNKATDLAHKKVIFRNKVGGFLTIILHALGSLLRSISGGVLQ